MSLNWQSGPVIRYGQRIVQRGDEKKWVALFNGYYSRWDTVLTIGPRLLRKDLEKMKNSCKCQEENFRCRMNEVGHCKAALSNLISSEKIQECEDPFKSFSEAILNFHSHYYAAFTSIILHEEKPTEFSPVGPRQTPSKACYRVWLTVLKTTSHIMGDYKCSRGLSWFGTHVQGQADRSGSRALRVQNKHGRLSQGSATQSY